MSHINAALAVAGSLALGTALAVPTEAAVEPVKPNPDDAPNVVIVLVDDARVDDLTTMPKVRSLIGDRGATFARAVSPLPLCCPARATLLTGQYAHNHGVLDNAGADGLAAFDESKTLATWLDRTYATAWVGKYLNEYGSTDGGAYVPPGWDRWAAPVGGWANYRKNRYSLDGTLTTFPGRYQTDVVGDLATDFVSANAGGEEPFFLVTSILAPHAGSPAEPDDPADFATPNVADEHVDAFSGLPLTRTPAFNESDVSDKPVKPGPLSSAEIAALTEVNQQRRESLLSAETVVQRLLTVLEQSGELDDTYVVFTSDNGYVLGEHRLRGGKLFPYEVATRVPLLMRGPGIPPGTTVDPLVGLQDLAPTVLSMAGVHPPRSAFAPDGLSLLDVMAQPEAFAQRPVVLEAGPQSDGSAEYRFHGLRTPRWKYVERSTGKRELYDLNGDPYELHNVAEVPSFAETRAALAAMLREYEYCAGASCLEPAGEVPGKAG